MDTLGSLSSRARSLSLFLSHLLGRQALMPQGCIFFYFLNKTEGAVIPSKICDTPRALMSIASNFCCDETEPRKITHSPDDVKLQPKAFLKMLVIIGKSTVNSEQEFTLAQKDIYLLLCCPLSPRDAPSGLAFLYLAMLTVTGKFHHDFLES